MIYETSESSQSSTDYDDPLENSSKANRALLKKVQRVLIMHPDERQPQDLRALAQQMKMVKFFKDRTKEGQKLALRDKDMEIICSHLDYLQLKKGSTVMRYGEEGDQFYLLLDGKVSVWVPVPFKQMAGPVKKLKELVNKELRLVRGDDEILKKHKLGEYDRMTQLPFVFKELRRLGELNDYFKVEEEELVNEKTNKLNTVEDPQAGRYARGAQNRRVVFKTERIAKFEVSILRMAQLQQGDMVELAPVLPRKIEQIGMVDKIRAICGPKRMTLLEQQRIQEKLKIDLALPLDEAEMAALLEREEDNSSERSESEVPYKTYEDFDKEIASRLRFDKVWNQKEKYFQWNMLVIDKAKEAIYGVEQSIIRRKQSWDKKEDDDVLGMYHGFKRKRTRRAHTITREVSRVTTPTKPVASDLKEILNESKEKIKDSRRMTQISPAKFSVAESEINIDNEILDLKISVSPARRSMAADFIPSNSLQLKTRSIHMPVHQLRAVSEIEKLLPAKAELSTSGNDFNQSLKRFNSSTLNDKEVEVKFEPEQEENIAQKLLDEKVPAHKFTVDDIEYEWYEGYYYKKVAEFKSGDSFGELALREEKGVGTRAATVKCMKRSHFATLTKKDYIGSLKRIDARLIMELTEFLNHIPCFKTQSKKALVLFTKFLKKVEFTRGQTVYSEGSYAKSIYIVWSGEFELAKKLPKGNTFAEFGEPPQYGRQLHPIHENTTQIKVQEKEPINEKTRINGIQWKSS